jgi:hypothetical protein
VPALSSLKEVDRTHLTHVLRYGLGGARMHARPCLGCSSQSSRDRRPRRADAHATRVRTDVGLCEWRWIGAKPLTSLAVSSGSTGCFKFAPVFRCLLVGRRERAAPRKPSRERSSHKDIFASLSRRAWLLCLQMRNDVLCWRRKHASVWPAASCFKTRFGRTGEGSIVREFTGQDDPRSCGAFVEM